MAAIVNDGRNNLKVAPELVGYMESLGWTYIGHDGEADEPKVDAPKVDDAKDAQTSNGADEVAKRLAAKAATVKK